MRTTTPDDFSTINSMGIVFLNEEDEYNIEGFAQMAENKAKFLDERELHYDYINDDEIIESNREYNYYSQHFYDRVNLFQLFCNK